MKKLIPLILLLGWGSAWAIPVMWTLDGVTFRDEVYDPATIFIGETGAGVTGSFVYDADTNTYSDIAVTVEAGATEEISPFWPELTYFGIAPWIFPPLVSGANGVTLQSHPFICPGGCSNELSLVYASPLTNAGGTVALDTSGASVSVDASVEMVFGNNLSGGRGSLHIARRIAGGTLIGTVVPLPAAVWLFGSGLAGLGFLRRKKS